MQLLGDAADNPGPAHRRGHQAVRRARRCIDRHRAARRGGDARSFVVILWGLSAAAPLTLFGTIWSIPGYLVWAALIYAIVGTALTHWIGRPLVGAQFPAAALRSRLPLQSRARARELRADRAARRRDARNATGCSTGSAAWSTTGMRSCRGTKQLTFFTAGYHAGLDRVSLSSWSARPISPARSSSAG